jgi:hypothetical protein
MIRQAAAGGFPAGKKTKGAIVAWRAHADKIPPGFMAMQGRMPRFPGSFAPNISKKKQK